MCVCYFASGVQAILKKITSKVGYLYGTIPGTSLVVLATREAGGTPTAHIRPAATDKCDTIHQIYEHYVAFAPPCVKSLREKKGRGLKNI